MIVRYLDTDAEIEYLFHTDKESPIPRLHENVEIEEKRFVVTDITWVPPTDVRIYVRKL